MANKGDSTNELAVMNQAQLTMAATQNGLQLDNEKKSLLHPNSHLRFMLTSVIASSIANVAGLLSGHPLDTIRVSTFFYSFFINIKATNSY